MPKQFCFTQAIVLSAAALAFSLTAQASATRTFVSTIGNDSNTTVNCSATANCRTFTAALSVTNPGGEIVVVTSGGYGPAIISQPVIITAIGVNASISVTTSDANGLTINTPGNVTLIGLNLHGEATGNDGILVQQVGFLRLYNMMIENFTHDGVFFDTSGNLAIERSRLNDNGNCAISLANGSTSVRNTSLDNNACGVGVFGGQATVTDSSAFFNGAGFLAQGGTLTLSNDRATINATGLQATSSGTLYFSNSHIANNTTAYDVESGSTMAGTSPGTSLITPSQTLTGTLGTAVALH